MFRLKIKGRIHQKMASKIKRLWSLNKSYKCLNIENIKKIAKHIETTNRMLNRLI